MKPKYPVYVISKGRADRCLTANFMLRDELPFRLVIEPQELDLYLERYPREIIEVLPFSNLGLGSIPARNWCWEHAKAEGHARHWIFDDNIRGVRRLYQGERVLCDSGLALAICESFVDRYSNVGIAGLLSWSLVIQGTDRKPFRRNCHVYSCLLLDNGMPYRWRGRYNEDTDLCLQVLSAGRCTIQFMHFMIEKITTMKMKGGNMTDLYKGDGRLKMARALERMWPGVAMVKRRYGRPQHVVDWRRFDTPLKLRPDVVLPQGADEFGMRLIKGNFSGRVTPRESPV